MLNPPFECENLVVNEGEFNKAEFLTSEFWNQNKAVTYGEVSEQSRKSFLEIYYKVK